MFIARASQKNPSLRRSETSFLVGITPENIPLLQSSFDYFNWVAMNIRLLRSLRAIRTLDSGHWTSPRPARDVMFIEHAVPHKNLRSGGAKPILCRRGDYKHSAPTELEGYPGFGHWTLDYFLIPITIASGPTRCSTLVSRKPASPIHAAQSLPVSSIPSATNASKKSRALRGCSFSRALNPPHSPAPSPVP